MSFFSALRILEFDTIYFPIVKICSSFQWLSLHSYISLILNSLMYLFTYLLFLLIYFQWPMKGLHTRTQWEREHLWKIQGVLWKAPSHGDLIRNPWLGWSRWVLLPQACNFLSKRFTLALIKPCPPFLCIWVSTPFKPQPACAEHVMLFTVL